MSESDNISDNKNNNTTSSKSVKRTPLTDTGLHVIKGAIVNILGKECAITTSVEFINQCKASITVTYDGDTLSADKILQIQNEANNIIKNCIPIKIIDISREEAEAKYNQPNNLINHTPIYDKYPIPDTVKQIKLLLIDNININCCSGQHLNSTNELLALGIFKSKNRKNKKEYEFSFVVGEQALIFLNEQEKKPHNNRNNTTNANTANIDNNTDDNHSNKQQTVKSQPKPTKSNKNDNNSNNNNNNVKSKLLPCEMKSNTTTTAEQLLALIKNNSKNNNDDGKLLSEFERVLTMFKNECYTEGFVAATQTPKITTHTLLQTQ